jgi:hypothetical protein
LLKTVLAAPDITLEDLRERLLSDHNIAASLAATVWRELQALKCCCGTKKSVIARERTLEGERIKADFIVQIVYVRAI